MNLSLSNITLKDFNSFHELFEIMHVYHQEKAPYFFQEYSENCFDKERFEKYITDSNCIHIKAEVDSKFIGYISGQIHDYQGDPMMKARKFSKIEQISVNPDYQNRGIGSKLMEEFQRISLENNCFNIELTVWSFNDQAVRLYNKLGYQSEVSNFKKFLY